MLRKVRAVGVLFSILAFTRAEAAPAVEAARASVKFGPTLTTPGTLGSSIDLRAARNEFEAFQVVVTGGFKKLKVSKPQLRKFDAQGNWTGEEIPPEEIRVYYEQPIHLSNASNAEGAPGDWPDPLVPMGKSDEWGRKNVNGTWSEGLDTIDRLTEVDSTTTGDRAIFFIDIHVPFGQPAGTYDSRQQQLVVTDDATQTQVGTIDVTFTVRPWDIPLTSTHPTLFVQPTDAECVAHGDSVYNASSSQWECVDDNARRAWKKLYGRFLIDHRISGTLDHSPGATVDSSSIAAYRQSYDSLIRGVDQHMHLRKELVIGAMPVSAAASTIEYPWWKYEPTAQNPEPTQPDRLSTWETMIAQHYPAQKGRVVMYAREGDEPGANTDKWWFVGHYADTIRAANHAIPVPLLVTTDIDDYTNNGGGTASDDINILSPLVHHVDNPDPASSLHGNQMSRYSQFLGVHTGFNHVWSYQSCEQHNCGGAPTPDPYHVDQPNYMVDATGIQNRAQPWLHYIYGTEGMLYYQMGERLKEAWDTDGLWIYSGNGDGTLVYPGTPSPVTNGANGSIGGTYHIPVASYRLKMLREGLEDWEYLKKCEMVGGDARAIALTLFPMTSPAGAPESGAMYNVNNKVSGNAARGPEELANLLEEQREALARCFEGATGQVDTEWSDQAFVSAPVLVGPVIVCGSGAQGNVTVSGVVNGATVQLWRADPVSGDSVIASQTAGWSDVVFTLPLTVNDTLYAKQVSPGGFVSDPSNSLIVNVQSGAPAAPELIRPDYFQCEQATIGGNIQPGAVAELVEGSTVIASGSVSTPGQALELTYQRLAGPPQYVQLKQTMCEQSNVSSPINEKATPTSLPQLIVQPCADAFGTTGSCVDVSGIEPGALVSVIGGGQTFTAPQPRSTQRYMFNALAGTSVTAQQSLCDTFSAVATGTTGMNSCNDLPAPQIDMASAIAPSRSITITSKVPGARINIFGGTNFSEEIGDSTLDVVPLKRALVANEVLKVIQTTQQCRGFRFFPVTVK